MISVVPACYRSDVGASQWIGSYVWQTEPTSDRRHVKQWPHMIISRISVHSFPELLIFISHLFLTPTHPSVLTSSFDITRTVRHCLSLILNPYHSLRPTSFFFSLDIHSNIAFSTWTSTKRTEEKSIISRGDVGTFEKNSENIFSNLWKIFY